MLTIDSKKEKEIIQYGHILRRLNLRLKVECAKKIQRVLRKNFQSRFRKQQWKHQCREQYGYLMVSKFLNSDRNPLLKRMRGEIIGGVRVNGIR